MASGKSAKKGGRQRHDNTALDLPPDLYEMYKSDPDETYGERKSRVQWICRYWTEQWFLYHFLTPEYADKNAVRPPWADIVYKKLHPKTKTEAIAKGFFPCMVRGLMPENADPSSLRWCREDDLIEANLQFAKASAAQNKKDLGIDFNPGPAAPRPDGCREAESNLIGPFDDFDSFLEHCAAQRATVGEAAEEEEHVEVPEPPKPKKKAKASKSSAAPKASSVKPLKSASPESSVQSEDLSRISKKSKKPKKISGQGLTPASIL
jgi:hypothetical protein